MSLDQITRQHLEEHHRLDPKSEFYFQPFKSGKPWVVRKYPSTGLQSTNTRTFGEAFIHPKNKKRWGFREDYTTQIAKVIEASSGHGPVPLSAVAIWIQKTQPWDNSATLSTVVNSFISTGTSSGFSNALSTSAISSLPMSVRRGPRTRQRPRIRLVASCSSITRSGGRLVGRRVARQSG